MDLEPGSIPGKHQAGKAYRTRKKGELAKGGTESVGASPGPGAGEQMDELKEDLDELVGNGDAPPDGYDGLRDGYAKICLLVNIGRINTTFAFYPAMRTVLRTYHSVPSLQKTQATRKSLQDAPRMKNALKAIRTATEPEDVRDLPATLEMVQDRMHKGIIPPTSVVNLIFVLGLGHDIVSERFFEQGNVVDPHNLLAARVAQPGLSAENGKLHVLHLFTTINIPSEERARMLLYILYHYLESDSGPNPFADPDRQDRPPTLHVLNDEEYATLHENIDEPDELEWGDEMRARRIESLKELAVQKQSAAAGATPVQSMAYTTASAATSARNSIEPSVLSYRPGLAESMDISSDRHSDVGTDASSRKRKRYSPLAPESLGGNTSLRLSSADGLKQHSRPPSPEHHRPGYGPHDLAFGPRSGRATPHARPDIHFAPPFDSGSGSRARSMGSHVVRGTGPSAMDISDSEDDEPPPIVRAYIIKTIFKPILTRSFSVGRRDRNDPRAMQDDWAHGVDISGLDEETVRDLIHQVNLEFGDPPTPEPEISWRDYERVAHGKRRAFVSGIQSYAFICSWTGRAS